MLLRLRREGSRVLLFRCGIFVTPPSLPGARRRDIIITPSRMLLFSQWSKADPNAGHPEGRNMWPPTDDSTPPTDDSTPSECESPPPAASGPRRWTSWR
eukprot:3859412-Pyramimonas_sp.AAC.1